VRPSADPGIQNIVAQSPSRDWESSGRLVEGVSSTGIEHVVNRVLYCATGTEFYISPG
jgi:hypothetical protein